MAISAAGRERKIVSEHLLFIFTAVRVTRMLYQTCFYSEVWSLVLNTILQLKYTIVQWTKCVWKGRKYSCFTC